MLSVTRKPLLEILTSKDNFADVLPAIPLPEPLADGELDFSIGGLYYLSIETFWADSFYPESYDTRSFACMTGLAAACEHGDSQFVAHSESSNQENPNIVPNITLDEQANSNMDIDLPEPQPIRRVQQQMLLPGAGPGIFTSHGKVDRCAVCVNVACIRRFDCPGKGNRAFCSCGHPALKKGQKVRRSEKDILGFLAKQDATRAASQSH